MKPTVAEVKTVYLGNFSVEYDCGAPLCFPLHWTVKIIIPGFWWWTFICWFFLQYIRAIRKEIYEVRDNF